MAKLNIVPAEPENFSKAESAEIKLQCSILLGDYARSVKKRGQYPKARLVLAEADRLVREVVELLAGAVGLCVSAESAAKPKRARKRARQNTQRKSEPQPVSTTAAVSA